MTDHPRAFVIGDPIAHSRSPLIHGSWLARYGIAGSYEAIHVKPDALAGFIDRLRNGDFVGGNVTIPHKLAVMALCDTVDEAARTIGAVNTLVRAPDGRIAGSNTDHIGFTANLDAEAPGWAETPGRAIVLGAGGAARAIVFALAQRGFHQCVILNRDVEKAAALAAELGAEAAARLDAFDTYAPSARLVVNTSAVGMGGTAFDQFTLDNLPENAIVTDIVYTPLVTPLLAMARARSLVTVDGLGMLLHQAVPGFAAWFGRRPEVTADLRARIIAAIAS